MKLANFITVCLMLGISNQVMARRASRAMGGISIRTMSTGSVNTNTITTGEIEKTDEVCIDLVYDCMENKTNEIVMQNEDFFDDYNDMLTDIYGGMITPSFKCIYDKNLKNLYSEYYYGIDDLDEVSGKTEEIKRNSIEYWSFLKQNAMDVASKKISPSMINTKILGIADINIFPMNRVSQDLPGVSYKSTLVNPDVEFEMATAYCIDPEKNEDLEGCQTFRKNFTEKWKEIEPNTVKKSCSNYEVFLADKKTKAERGAEVFIIGLRTKLINVIEEHNAKIIATQELLFED